jgi:hypothetical protein
MKRYGGIELCFTVSSLLQQMERDYQLYPKVALGRGKGGIALAKRLRKS